MFEALNGEFTFLSFLSILAFLTTVGLFFCGIPICRQIWKRKDTSEISGAPFLMGVLGGTCWSVYGYLKKDDTVLYVTGAQIVLYSTYTVFYWFMTQKKFWISVQTALLVVICASLVAMIHFFGHKVFHPLGFICMTLNIGDFAAPLAGLRVVIRRRATSTLPLPLCIANFLVSSEWFLYGLLKWDFYLITPNGIGSLLAFSQLILFVVLPRKPNQRAPFLRIYDGIRGCCQQQDSLDLEKANVVPAVEKSLDKMAGSIHRISRQRWSSRVITNVVGEVENVIQKVQLSDQFGYSGKLNKRRSEEEEGGSTDSVLTPEEESKEFDGAKIEAAGQPNDQQKVVDEMQQQQSNVDFAASGRSLKLSAKSLQKLAANFGATAGTADDDFTDDEELSEERDSSELGGGGGRKEEDGTDEDDGDEDGQPPEELVFPITIRDASQLLRLSRRFSKKPKPLKKRGQGGPVFGLSLQQQHFRALRHRQQQQQQQNDGVPIIAEESTEEEDGFSTLKQRLKRARSEPSLAEQQRQQHQQEQEKLETNENHRQQQKQQRLAQLEHFERM